MADKGVLFDNFLTEIDKTFAEYFKSNDHKANNIRECFGAYGGGHLIYHKPKELRLDIKDIVIKTHKAIYEGVSSYKEVD